MSPSNRRRIAGEQTPGSAAAPAPAPVVRKKSAAAATPAEPESTDTVVDDATAKPVVPSAAKAKAAVAESAESTTASPARWLLLALALVFLVGGGFLLFRGITASIADDPGDGPLDAAKLATEDIFSFNYEHFDAYKKDAFDAMTDRYQVEYEEILPALTNTAPEAKTIAQAVARAAGTMPCSKNCSEDRVDVLVYYDQARLNEGAQEPAIFDQAIKMTMVKVDDRWLVDDIKAMNPK